MSGSNISEAFVQHYSSKIREHGPNAKGVDWVHEDRAVLRQDMMLAVLRAGVASLLDVGCGYGALLDRALARDLALDYHGIDIVPEMVAHGRARHPAAQFNTADFLTMSGDASFDYVVCNGILTLKLAASQAEMDSYAKSIIRKMFAICRVGIAFNVMSSAVNFYSGNLFYKSPVEMLAFCMSELSPNVRLDHSYPLYEFTTYVYRD